MLRGISFDHEQLEDYKEIFYNRDLSVSDVIIKVILDKSGS